MWRRIVLLLNFVVPEWRVNHEFVPTTCKVLDKRIGEWRGEDGPLLPTGNQDRIRGRQRDVSWLAL